MILGCPSSLLGTARSPSEYLLSIGMGLLSGCICWYLSGGHVFMHKFLSYPSADVH
jgi:hypothetical protein